MTLHHVNLRFTLFVQAQYIQNLAQNFVDKSITPERFSQMSHQEISTQLCAVKGIGQVSSSILKHFGNKYTPFYICSKTFSGL